MTTDDEVAGSGDSLPVDEGRGWCLCLSGGGFRATLFHLGAVLRLNELGVLARLSTVTSVSGGSILNGVLATRWSRLRLGPDGVFTNLDAEVASTVRAFCSSDLRTPLLVGTRLNPANWLALARDWFSVSANFLAEGYELLYQSRLRDLPPPGPGTPRFVFCATNVRSGACWHFHGGPGARMGDFYTGYCDVGRVRVSDAVAASSAFPPGFSALRLHLPDATEFSRIDPWGEERPEPAKRGGGASAGRPVLLTDGGVYDNLAVEPVWERYRTLLVSDAGRPFASVPESGQSLGARLKRAIDISMEQVGAVRRRWLVADFFAGRRTGAVWTLHTRLVDFNLADARGYGADSQPLLHGVRTDLNPFTEGESASLVNHGYSLADAAVRSRAQTLCPNPGAPFRWPATGWSTDSRLTEALARSSRRGLWRDVWRYLTFRGPRYRPPA